MLFKALWLSRMPADIRGHVQLQIDNLNCVQLGELADKIWLSKHTGQLNVLAAAVPGDDKKELADTVAVLRLRKLPQP